MSDNLCLVCKGPLIGMHGSTKVHPAICRAFRVTELGRQHEARRRERRRAAKTREVVCVNCNKPFPTTKAKLKILCSKECKKIRDRATNKKNRINNIDRYRELSRARYAATSPELRKTYPDRRNGAERYRKVKNADPQAYLEAARSYRRRNRERINEYQRALAAEKSAAIRLIKAMQGQTVREISHNPTQNPKARDKIRTRELYLKNRERLRAYKRKRNVERVAALNVVREMKLTIQKGDKK